MTKQVDNDAETSVASALNSEVDEWIKRAKSGDRSALSSAMEAYRDYLLLAATAEIEGWMRCKVGASDIVQQTLLEAYAGFDGFQGQNARQFFAWLVRIMRNHLVDVKRMYFAHKRRTSREISLDSLDQRRVDWINRFRDDTSPSEDCRRRSLQQTVARVMETLDEDERQVIVLRHQESLRFREIGLRMNRSPDAARMLWCRAVVKLERRLESYRDELT